MGSLADGLCPHARTIEINADKDSLALELDVAGQTLERFLSCML
jgi:hypothetical protein